MWSKWYSSLEEAVAPENPTTGASNRASGRIGKHSKKKQEAGTWAMGEGEKGEKNWGERPKKDTEKDPKTPKT